jgi:TPR repeat protein
MLRPRTRFLAIVSSSAAICLLLLSRIDAVAVPGLDADLPDVRTAAEHGHVHDQIALGNAYLSGRGVNQDFKLAAYWYEKAAGAGDPLAQNEIGYFYQIGLGVSHDSTRAVHWFQLAAAGGFVDAKVNLAVAYMWGNGVQQDQRLGEQLIREAADKGSGTGAAYMGEMYYFGIGMKQDQTAAEPWYEKGAKLHNSLALYRIGVILSRPADHPRNLQRSAALMRESASAGFVPAMHSLGMLMINHPEFMASQEEALSLLNEAAADGTWKSSVVLGILSRDGKLVPKDDKEAYFHFKVAALQGGNEATALVANDLKKLDLSLEADRKAQVDKDARAWVKQHNVPLEVVYRNSERLSRFPAFALSSTAPEIHAVGLIPTNPF